MGLYTSVFARGGRMDFRYSPVEEQFRQEVRTWLETNVPADLRSGGDEDLVPHERWERQKTWHKKLHEGGWIGIWWPKEYGGRGASVIEQAIFNEELGRLGVSSGVNMSGVTLLGPTLMHWGTEEQKKRFLPTILPADEIWCQGYSEPGAGSDLASLQTRAVEDGDHFVVNGQKVWTSWAQYSDWIFLLVRTDPNAPKHQGISYLLVDMHNPGITVRPLTQINGDAEFNEVFFEDVRVPKKNLVGELNRGWMVAVTTLMFERVSTSNFYRFEKILPQLCDLARHVQLVDGRPAIADAAVRQQLAQFAIEAQAIKYNDLRRLTRQLKGMPPGPEGSFSKTTSTELNMRICIFAMELLGPYAILEKGSPFAVDHARWSYRMLGARAGTIAAGTNEIQRGIIGERVLGLPKAR
jgi:alkylation response protein AidB-like acyl-CoA dehydrogenase